MSDETRVLAPPDPDHCPQCSAPLVRLTGGGAIETYCAVCGFAVRQSAPRRAESADLVRRRLASPSAGASAVITVTTSRPRRRLFWFPRSWIARAPLLVLLAVAVRSQFAGYPDFGPVLLGQLYIHAFATIVVFMPLFVRQAEGAVASWSVVLLVPAAFAGAWLAARFAPVIGEPNYCGSTYISDVAVTPPHIFRCTSTPFTLAGFIAGWWLAGWLLERWVEWRETRG